MEAAEGTVLLVTQTDSKSGEQPPPIVLSNLLERLFLVVRVRSYSQLASPHRM